jgi:ATPase subunit of ABC transporter with duplicated ATPase domains
MSTETTQIIYSMIGVNKRYENKVVLKDIYLSYYYGAKIGVLGLNGAGKSSLLRIMAGVDSDYEGQINRSAGYSVGFLEQEPLVDSNLTVREVAEQGARQVTDLLASSIVSMKNWRKTFRRRRWRRCSSGRGKSRRSSTAWTPGTSTRSSIWRWTRCAAPRAIRRSG